MATTATPTRTERAAVLALRAGGVVAELRRGPRLAPRVLERCASGVVRAAFVPTQAGPLAGDRDRVRIVVGAGATLVVEPVAATLALPGARRTLLALDIEVQEGGRLVLDEGPLIVAAGADVERRCALTLAGGAIAALRETVVLGRDGEPPGTLSSVLRATLEGRPLLHDALRIGPCRADDHVALAPGHRVVGTACLLGSRAPAVERAYDLEGPGALLRASGAALAEVEPALAAAWQAWARAAIQPRATRTGRSALWTRPAETEPSSADVTPPRPREPAMITDASADRAAPSSPRHPGPGPSTASGSPASPCSRASAAPSAAISPAASS